MNNMTEQDNKKGNVMFMVPEIPGTPWEKAARLVQMLKDGNAKLRGELARIETQLALQGVYMSIVEDQLHAQYMKFEEMLLERLKTCGIAADEVNYIYAKLKRERQEDGQKEDLPPWPEHVSTSEIDEAIASLVKDGEIEVGDARELRKGAIKFNAKMKKCRAKMKKCRKGECK